MFVSRAVVLGLGIGTIRRGWGAQAVKRPHILLVAGLAGVIIGFGLTACDQSVGDASLVDPVTGRPVNLVDTARARVRNESTSRADVTLRFIRDATVVHLAFVRVLPQTVTTVTSPEPVDLVELSGISDGGEALSNVTFVFGVDFNEVSPAEYLVRDGAMGEPVGGPSQGPSARTTLSLLQPAEDIAVSLGSTVEVRWEDTSGDPGAIVSLYLRPVGSADEADWIPVSPAIGASLDGTNDRIAIVIEGVGEGTYEVVARIADGVAVETAVAPGLIGVRSDPFNQAPSLTIVAPAVQVLVREGDSVTVQWRDTDPDDNATILFTLESTDRVTGPVDTFTVSPPIAEDPDGATADASTILIRDILPGLYDLVGTIDDGQLIGTARLEAAVRVLPEPDNDPPQLTLSEPAEDVDVSTGDSILVRWTDADANDNARISLLLDPHPSPVALDGDEILLVSSLGENADGSGDRVTLGIPAGVPSGPYRLAGVITDGLTQVVAQAPGIVYVDRPASNSVGGGGGGSDGVDSGGGGGGGPGGGSGGPGIDDDGGDDDPAEPISPVTITILDSAEDVLIEGSEPFDVLVETGAPVVVERRRYFLSNLPYGGDVRVDVTPVDAPISKRSEVSIQTDAVPNDAWPRRFDLEIETISEGQLGLHVAPRPVWIRQEVAVSNLEWVGDPCGMDGMDGTVALIEEPFARVNLTWYGGGYEDRDNMTHVQFWLTSDGEVPEDGVGDSTHELIYRQYSSPNEYQVFGMALEPVSEEVLDMLRPRYPVVPNTVGPGVDPGIYYLVTVLDPDGPDRTVSAPHSERLEFCDRSH